jgi:hypothetical protein
VKVVEGFGGIFLVLSVENSGYGTVVRQKME